jgi:hypothetical protein
MTPAKDGSDNPPQVPHPVNVVDGIPDRAMSRSPWPCVVIAAVFFLWVGVLIYCGLAAVPQT